MHVRATSPPICGPFHSDFACLLFFVQVIEAAIESGVEDVEVVEGDDEGTSWILTTPKDLMTLAGDVLFVVLPTLEVRFDGPVDSSQQPRPTPHSRCGPPSISPNLSGLLDFYPPPLLPSLLVLPA